MPQIEPRRAADVPSGGEIISRTGQVVRVVSPSGSTPVVALSPAGVVAISPEQVVPFRCPTLGEAVFELSKVFDFQAISESEE